MHHAGQCPVERLGFLFIDAGGSRDAKMGWTGRMATVMVVVTATAMANRIIRRGCIQKGPASYPIPSLKFHPESILYLYLPHYPRRKPLTPHTLTNYLNILSDPTPYSASMYVLARRRCLHPSHRIAQISRHFKTYLHASGARNAVRTYTGSALAQP